MKTGKPISGHMTASAAQKKRTLLYKKKKKGLRIGIMNKQGVWIGPKTY